MGMCLSNCKKSSGNEKKVGRKEIDTFKKLLPGCSYSYKMQLLRKIDETIAKRQQKRRILRSKRVFF